MRRSVFASLLLLAARVAFAQAVVTGFVYDSLRTKAPLAGATVVINELSFYTTTDARGRFTFDKVAAGKYSITFLHPTLDTLLMAAEMVPLEVPDTGRVVARLAIPSAPTVMRRVCGERDSSTGFVIGAVRGIADGTSLAGVVVQSNWTDLELTPKGIVSHPQSASGRTNRVGHYLLCGVPTDIAVQISAAGDSVKTGPVEIYLRSEVAARQDFRLGRSAAPSGTVTGVVRTGRTKAAAGAQVRLVGTDRTATTDADGRFAIPSVVAGTQTVEARMIGARPVSLTVDVLDRAPTELNIDLDKLVAELPSVSIIGKRKETGRFAEFLDRSRTGAGHYMDEAAIAKTGAWDIAEVLGHVPGLKVEVPQSAAAKFVTMRGCLPTFYLDGSRWLNDAWSTAAGDGLRKAGSTLGDLSAFYHSDNIRGIEVYSSATAPSQYSTFSDCGVILLWTK